VQGVLDLLTFEARRRGIELVCGFDADLPRVHADPDQIQQVILNLVSNALAATPAGGTVTVRLAAGAMLAPGGGREVPCARLTVTDTGCGISEDHLPHLFEAFFTTRAGEGGTGLGLAVVSAIVAEHGGTLAVESEPGSGTEFVISLPLGRGEAP
jgi:signal transduction histidine kinase